MTRDSSPRGAAVILEGLEKSFDSRSVLQGIDLVIQPGELVALVGRSGSGKTTLLRVLSGLEEPTAGTARILSVDGQDARTGVRVVFQEPRLLPWRSVRDNVLIGMPKGRDNRADQVLSSVGLGDRLSDYPGVLSGGQRQRVALARALVHEPRVMLLDEPFGALDALTRIDAQTLVEKLWREHGFTAILVTHDVAEAVLLGDRVLVVDDGRIAARFNVDLPRPRRRDQPELARLTGLVLEAIFASTSIPPSDPHTPPAIVRSEIAETGRGYRVATAAEAAR